MELRKIFDTIPEKFDKWRPQYCDEVFEYLIDHVHLNTQKSILEIGPGTGQATEPILKTGCHYLGVELGENLAKYTQNKFKCYKNFHLIHDDFITHDFGKEKFDFIYSAATIQWIPEKIAFSKTHELLKNGGTLAMMMLHGDYKTPNEALYYEIQKVYAEYFHPETPYTQKFDYGNVVNYGFTEFQRLEFYSKREYTADEYIEYLGTHCDHIALKEPFQSNFYEGIRNAILSFGDKICFHDTIILYLAKKAQDPDIDPQLI